MKMFNGFGCMEMTIGYGIRLVGTPTHVEDYKYVTFCNRFEQDRWYIIQAIKQVFKYLWKYHHYSGNVCFIQSRNSFMALSRVWKNSLDRND